MDGDADGDVQRSHIVNAAMTYDLSQQWTLGLKYGFRLRDRANREELDFARSLAHRGVARLDHHLVHNWDILVEGRAMLTDPADVTDLGALAGVYATSTATSAWGSATSGATCPTTCASSTMIARACS